MELKPYMMIEVFKYNEKQIEREATLKVCTVSTLVHLIFLHILF